MCTVKTELKERHAQYCMEMIAIYTFFTSKKDQGTITKLQTSLNKFCTVL